MTRFALTAAVAAALTVCTAAADAALVVRITDASAAPGESVPIGVFVTNDTTAPDVSSTSVNAYNAAIFVDPATPATAANGSFGGLGAAGRTDFGFGYVAPQFLSGGDLFDGGDYREADLGARQSIQAFNALPDANAGQALSTADGNGLFQTTFAVPADALPGTTYTLRVDADATSFSTPGANSVLIDFTSTFATITVTPEPATLTLVGLPAALLLRRRR